MKKYNKNKELLVIIPVYNEEKNIWKVITDINNNLKNNSDILVINDASTDKTKDILEKNKINYIDLIFRVKYGAVLQTGFKYALYNNYKYIATIDGDAQHKAKYLVDMYKYVKSNKSDLVIGSRFVKNTDYKMPILKRFGSRLFSGIIYLLSKNKIKDPTSGFQLFNRKVLEFYCSDSYPTDYPDADVLLRLLYNKIRIKEVPVIMERNLEKSMHSGLSVLYYAVKMFFSIFIVVILNKELKNRTDVS